MNGNFNQYRKYFTTKEHITKTMISAIFADCID